MLIDKNINSYKEISAPIDIRTDLPLTKENIETIERLRKEIEDILSNKSNKKIIITGPCSIHNTEEALEYAKKLATIQEVVKDKFLLVMRLYFEKPRSTIGWKGLLFDPNLDNTFNMEEGIKKARKLCLDVTNLSLPIATEFLDPFAPQYIGDLISWAAIGARTTESQTHRQMTSGLSMPVGLKNATNGSIDVAIDAMISASSPHSFLGMAKTGEVSIVNTKGNPFTHVVLRGGSNGENYDEISVKEAQNKLASKNQNQNIIIDCSHANSNKDHTKQPEVLENVIQQINRGNNKIAGVMLESNLEEGNQSISENLKPGVSITDKCINWETTSEIIKKAHKELK